MIQVIETSVVVKMTLEEAAELKSILTEVSEDHFTDAFGVSNALSYLLSALEHELGE